ncbi:MAG TPA: urea transporter, partial [Candidatus Avalokitesvara rifleensis]|uniref:urea transporter n=1 Tax=Candidatus Avalokitesvara rifleensis TaxID=3367620 RepID=UPI0040266081
NGALIGLTWPFFWPLSYFSPPLLILAAGLSTLFVIPLRNIMSSSKRNLPIVSIPFVVIFLIFLVSAYASGLLPWNSFESTPPIHSLDAAGIYRRASHAAEWRVLGQQLLCHAVPVGIFLAGILVYSRISAL